jgi:hypothetical protein
MNKLAFPIFLCLLTSWIGHTNADYKCFYGNLHGHTDYSDGQSTPDTAYAYARDIAEIDVQAITEHNNGGGNYSITPENYAKLKSIADSMTVNGVFVPIYGQELGTLGSSGFGHICIWDAPQLWAYDNSDLIGCYSWIGAQNRPAMFCHPDSLWNSNFNHLGYYREYDQSMDLLEVINGSTIYQGAYLQALANGWHIGASANQDNHQRDWGNRVNFSGNIPLTGIWADTLTKAAILEALQARRTTAMEISPANDRIRLLLSVDGHYQGERFISHNSEVFIKITASAITAFKKIYLYYNGNISDSINFVSADTMYNWQISKKIDIGTNYLFAKAVQSDNDCAWTSPVFIDAVSDNIVNNLSNSQVATWPTPIKTDATIVFVPVEGALSVKAIIYDISGTKMRELDGRQPQQSIVWDGKDNFGKIVPSGVYVIKLEQRTATETKISLGKTAVSR